MASFGATKKDTEVRLPRATKVKNKQPAERQITAEQLLREAKEIQLEDDFKKPKTIINDPEELAEYRLKKRKEFEDLVRRVGRFNLTIWVKVSCYAPSLSHLASPMHPCAFVPSSMNLHKCMHSLGPCSMPHGRSNKKIFEGHGLSGRED
jgi:hypothetical protein